MTFTTKLRTGFEVGTFLVSDSGSVTVTTPTTNSNPATKIYTDNKVNDAVTLLSTQTTVLTGDISGTGISSITTVLSLTGVTQGTYGLVSVDTKGRVTSGTNFVYNLGNVQGSVTGNQVTLNLQTNGVTTGTYNIVTIDSTGRVISGSSLTSTNITNALGFIPVNKSGDTLTGRLSLNLLPTSSVHLVNKLYSDRQFYMALALGY